MGGTRVALAASLGAVLVAGSGAQALTLGTLHSLTTNTPVAGAITRVVVTSDVGNVSVQPGRTSSVQTHRQWNYAAPTVTQTLANGVLTVSSQCPRELITLNSCAVDLLLTVPQAVSVRVDAGAGDVITKQLAGREDLHAGAGSLRISGIRADALSLRAGAGDVVASAIDAGSLVAVADAGSVQATGLSVGSFTGRSGAGEVDASFASVPSLASAVADAGSVTLTVPKGTYDVRARADSGRVRVSGVTRAEGSPHKLVAESGAGDASITGR